MPAQGLAKNFKESPVKTIGGIVTIIATVFGILWGIVTNVVFKDDIVDLAKSSEVEAIQKEIIQTVKDQSSKIRIVYLHDLEARLEDVEVEIDELTEAGENVPTSLRRSARRLGNRIQEITTDQ